jgi:branched-subunit amino acid transport protein
LAARLLTWLINILGIDNMLESSELSTMFNDAGMWAALIAACVGTYFWRGFGVYFSGKINQDSELFKWLSAVTYAMVAALTVRIILLPVGLLATVPISVRLGVSIVALIIMYSKPGERMIPALLVGTFGLVLYGLVMNFLG